MTDEQNGAAAREIPVPPGGGSWGFDEIAGTWVSNDPAPAADVALADQVAPNSIEQEQ